MNTMLCVTICRFILTERFHTSFVSETPLFRLRHWLFIIVSLQPPSAILSLILQIQAKIWSIPCCLSASKVEIQCLFNSVKRVDLPWYRSVCLSSYYQQ